MFSSIFLSFNIYISRHQSIYEYNTESNEIYLNELLRVIIKIYISLKLPKRKSFSHDCPLQTCRGLVLNLGKEEEEN